MDSLKQIRKELKESADKKTKASFQRFFKENVKCYGVKTGTVGKIAKKYWKEIKDLDKKEMFALCEELYKSDYTEEAFIVSWWVPNLTKEFAESDFKIFERWIGRYINNWAKCDGFCNHSLGNFIEKFPRYISELKKWARSDNRWLKRAAAVSLIVPAKAGNCLKDAFEISDLLIHDPDDLVQKGYGWLLKEESRKHTKEVFDYVYKNRLVMPRTALRYAIELMPKDLKVKAMERSIVK
jgi:3-methyladenine DNA glycosylase AlkD